MLACVILCGGLATRLRPITEKIPKSLIPIAGEPFIAHQLRLLKSSGIEQVVLCVGFLGEMIKELIGEGTSFDLRVAYSFDGARLRGTAGAIRNALPALGRSFFVLYGDSYLPCSYKLVEEAFLESEKHALMTIFHNQGHFDTSNVHAEKGVILEYDKRSRNPRMQYIDYGLGVFHRSVFEALPPDDPQDLAQVYQKLLVNNSLAGYEVLERFYEIGSASGIQDLNNYLFPARALLCKQEENAN